MLVDAVLLPLTKHHRFISLVLYFLGMCNCKICLEATSSSWSQNRLCIICNESESRPLQVPIHPVWVDPYDITHRCCAVALHHRQYLRGVILVSSYAILHLSSRVGTKELYFRFILPVALVICNDIFAYIFGFFFGRTRLIALSPKKTWEGFIGGLLCTLVLGFLVGVHPRSFRCRTWPQIAQWQVSAV